MELNDVNVVEKPWGREIHFAIEDEYIGKILEVENGKRLSLQHHEKKKETFFVFSGELELTLGEEKVTLSEGSSVTIKPGVKHRVHALSDVKIFEVSTPHLDDVVRFEDDHGRVG